MGRLMDRVLATINLRQSHAAEQVRADLARIAPHCRWIRGSWEGLGLRWNEVQNVPKHINELSNFLVRTYLGTQPGR